MAQMGMQEHSTYLNVPAKETARKNPMTFKIITVEKIQETDTFLQIIVYLLNIKKWPIMAQPCIRKKNPTKVNILPALHYHYNTEQFFHFIL